MKVFSHLQKKKIETQILKRKIQFYQLILKKNNLMKNQKKTKFMKKNSTLTNRSNNMIFMSKEIMNLMFDRYSKREDSNFISYNKLIVMKDIPYNSSSKNDILLET